MDGATPTETLQHFQMTRYIQGPPGSVSDFCTVLYGGMWDTELVICFLTELWGKAGSGAIVLYRLIHTWFNTDCALAFSHTQESVMLRVLVSVKCLRGNYSETY